ncbi:uncharacterized protein LOC112553102 [Pogonomyrmex barbatus]|uniref:Uncharacterized protein LOC112553102 n=1 Tax=Pogonomyrmex barbatus TaxID=144034 RepID=A0A8N1SCQ6_9HYME|nr:uncharacterized protein LOC112553102 [Pogonomyrmex barbatus]
MSIRKKMRRAEASCLSAGLDLRSPYARRRGGTIVVPFAHKVWKKPGALTQRPPLHSAFFLLFQDDQREAKSVPSHLIGGFEKYQELKNRRRIKFQHGTEVLRVQIFQKQCDLRDVF